MRPETGAPRRPSTGRASASSSSPVQEKDVHTQVIPPGESTDGASSVGESVDGNGATPEGDELFTPEAVGPAGSGAMIVFERVTKIYEPNVVALNDVSFAIEKGEFVFVVGASGSGKSTMIRLLLKEMEPSSGRVVVGGRDLTRLKRSRVPLLRRNVGCVFQDFKLLPNRTAGENIAYALKVQGASNASIRRNVPEVLSLVGLSDKTGSLPDELSGGEQQRVSIARAVVNHPPLLICDEPTGNLDPDTSVGIMQLLYRINRAGTTILMATHDREMVDKMRKRVIALEDGRLARDERRGGYASE